MGLIDYIKGKRYGEEANKLERESMEDPFLQEALDGYDTVISNHTNSIERLRDSIGHQSKEKNQHKLVFYWSLAAGVALVLGVGSVFIFNSSDEELIAENSETTEFSISEMDALEEDVTIAATPVVDDDEPAEIPEINIVESEVEEAPARKENTKVEKKVEKKIVDNHVMTRDDKSVASAAETKAEAVDKQVQASNNRLEEVAKVGQSRAMAKEKKAASETTQPMLRAKTPAKDFEKSEFKDFFYSKAKKGEEKKVVEVEFTIGSSQRPSSINIKDASSEEAKKEALRIIKSSPQWTEKVGEKVKLKLKW